MSILRNGILASLLIASVAAIATSAMKMLSPGEAGKSRSKKKPDFEIINPLEEGKKYLVTYAELIVSPDKVDSLIEYIENTPSITEWKAKVKEGKDESAEMRLSSATIQGSKTEAEDISFNIMKHVKVPYWTNSSAR